MEMNMNMIMMVNTRCYPDQTKFVDPDVWNEDLWAHDLAATGSEFSPNIGSVDICSGSTVSPSEILMNNPTMPTPTFSSPYLFDSPSEGYETSPLFGVDDVSDSNGWFSLFPDTNPDSEEPGLVTPSQNHHHTQHSPHQNTGDEMMEEEDSRDSSDSPGTSPKFSGSSRGEKRSSTSGIRKRSMPLPPIVVEDPSDIIAMKRARNTLAARKSRAKKAEKMDEMEVMIERLQAEVEHWKNIALNKEAM